MAEVAAVGTTANVAEPCFEGMAYALSLIAMELWPTFGFRRQHVLAHGWRGPSVDMDAVRAARIRLKNEGRVRLRDFGGATGTGWERDSPYRWVAWRVTDGPTYGRAMAHRA